MSNREAAPSPIAGRGRSPTRWRPWPATRAPRCWPAARAWSRCCRCGWPRPSHARRHQRAARARPIDGRPTKGCGSARWPGTPTCSPPTDVRRVQPLVSLALAHVAHATIRNRGTTVGSLVHADAAAEMPVVLTLLGGSVESPGPAAPARSRPPSSTSGRWSPRWRTTRSPRRRSSRPWRRAAGRLRGDRPPARRLRAGRRRRRRRRATGSQAGYLSVSDVPTVVDLTGSRRRRLGRRGARRSSTRPTTSTPPPPTAPSWCGC